MAFVFVPLWSLEPTVKKNGPFSLVAACLLAMSIPATKHVSHFSQTFISALIAYIVGWVGHPQVQTYPSQAC